METRRVRIACRDEEERKAVKRLVEANRGLEEPEVCPAGLPRSERVLRSPDVRSETALGLGSTLWLRSAIVPRL